MCFGVAREETLKVLLQRGNPWLPSFLIHRYAAQFLSYAIVIFVSLVML
jgi:hypothetical protein